MLRAAVLAITVLAAPASAAPRAIPATDLIIRQSSPTLNWRWRTAPETATQPGLLAAMRAAALKDAAKARAGAASDAASARKAGIPFRVYETVNDWTVAADTPRLLALAGEIYSFTGGAHGNSGYAAKIWDKTAKRAVPIDALFSDWPRARKLIEPVFCKALADEQKARRGGHGIAGDFDKCPQLSEQPIVPWGGLGARAGQFRVLIGPYVAGPYAEGAYVITASWPEAVRGLAKPAYRSDLFGSGG